MATEHHNTEHPSSMKYVVIALILSVVTAIEVAVVYVEALSAVLIPILLILSIGKFVVLLGITCILNLITNYLLFYLVVV